MELPISNVGKEFYTSHCIQFNFQLRVIAYIINTKVITVHLSLPSPISGSRNKPRQRRVRPDLRRVRRHLVSAQTRLQGRRQGDPTGVASRESHDNGKLSVCFRENSGIVIGLDVEWYL